MKRKSVFFLLLIGLWVYGAQGISWADDVDVNGHGVVNTDDLLAVPDGMVLIPAGTFQMGSVDLNLPSSERPIHTVYVSAFYMDKYEVTNAQYAAFLNAKRKHAEGDLTWLDLQDKNARVKHVGGRYRVQVGYEDHPVHATWYGAMAYAAWTGKRLPTEAEWEKAARGGLVGQKYPWGNSIDAGMANYDQNVGGPTPVGQYPANGYGLYDMAGNVWEWCLDEGDLEFYIKSLKSPTRDPIAGAPNITHMIDNYTNFSVHRNVVVRGGCWSTTVRSMRVARRVFSSPLDPKSYIGFRCVRSVKSEKSL